MHPSITSRESTQSTMHTCKKDPWVVIVGLMQVTTDHTQHWSCDARFEWADGFRFLCDERILDPGDGRWKSVEELISEIGEEEFRALYSGIMKREVMMKDQTRLVPPPSLHLRPHQIPTFVSLLQRLDGGFHRFVIRDLAVFADMTISIFPSAISQDDTSDHTLFPPATSDKWRPSESIPLMARPAPNATHPMVRLDVKVPRFAVTLTAAQMSSLLPLGMLLVNDFGKMVSSVNAIHTDPLRCTLQQSEFYVRYWPVKLLYCGGPSPILAESELLPVPDTTFFRMPNDRLLRRGVGRKEDDSRRKELLEIIQWLSWFEATFAEELTLRLRGVALRGMDGLPLAEDFSSHHVTDFFCGPHFRAQTAASPSVTKVIRPTPASTATCSTGVCQSDLNESRGSEGPVSALMQLLEHFGLGPDVIRHRYRTTGFTNLVEMSLSLLDVSLVISMESEKGNDVVLATQGLLMNLNVSTHFCVCLHFCTDGTVPRHQP